MSRSARAGRHGARAAPADDGASLLAAARRVLVTGGGGLDLAAAAAACDVAERLAAAVDPGDPDIAAVAGPVLPRTGGVTAAVGELHDRADLVVAWFAPVGVVAELLGDAGARPAGPRKAIVAVGPEPLPGAEHLRLEPDEAVAAARAVRAACAGVDPGDVDPAVAAVARRLAPLIAAAGCTAFVTATDSDPVGLPAWAVADLVRSLAVTRPAFAVPLESDDRALATVCTWRYGGPGGIARADRMGGEFLPAECDAVRLIARGEVDAVLVAGRATAAVEAALAATTLPVVRLDATGLARLAARLVEHRP